MSDSQLSIDPNAQDASNDVSGAVSNDEETRLDAPLPPSSGGANDVSYDAGNAPDSDNNSNAIKDPDDWTTGDEPMTGAQKSYLKTLSDQAGEELDESLSKADASKRIEELQHKTGRGGENSTG